MSKVSCLCMGLQKRNITGTALYSCYTFSFDLNDIMTDIGCMVGGILADCDRCINRHIDARP